MRRSRSLFRFVQAGTFFVPIPPQRLTGCQGAAVSPLAPPAGRTNSQRRMRAGCQWDGKALAGNGRHVCVNRSLRRGRGFGKDRRWSKSEKGEIEYNQCAGPLHVAEPCLRAVPRGQRRHFAGSSRRFELSAKRPGAYWSAIPADWRLAPVPRHSDRIAVRARAPNDPTNGTSTSRHQRPGGYRIVVASSGRFLRIFEH